MTGNGRIRAALSGHCQRRRPGFTLFEMMIAMTCMALLLVPAWRIFKFGTHSSLQGMAKVNTTLEAQIALKQVYNDLKNATIEYGLNAIRLDAKNDIIPESAQPPYSFFIFPQQGHVEDSYIPSEGGGEAKILNSPHGNSLPENQKGLTERLLSQITYQLEPSRIGNGLVKRLIRRERFHPSLPVGTSFPSGMRETVLSERVQTFKISHQTFLGDPAGNANRVIVSFLITLQLVDFPPGEVAPKLPVDPENVPNGIVISDFYQVVCPDFYNRLFNREDFNLNWHSGATSSTGK